MDSGRGVVLVAMVLYLRPVDAARLPVSHGVFAYTAFLDMVLRVDPGLSHLLHRPGPKPFTVSPLTGPLERQGGDFVLSPDRLYAWRLTGLTAEVARCLEALRQDLRGVRIGPAVFTVVGSTTSSAEDPEAGQDDCEAILGRWREALPAGELIFRFLSPTVFRVGRGELPFPLPRLVLGSLRDLWNAFAGVRIPEGFEEFVEQGVVLSNWRGETRRVEFGSRRTVGFTGKYHYRLTRPSEWGRWLGVLGDYAFYAGVGWQRTHGLGQVRVSVRGAENR